MEHTEYYQLSLWEQDDRIQMEDFNADNQKIDTALAAAGPKFAIGTYTGTGEVGSAHPHTLTFDFAPKIVLIRADLGAFNGGELVLIGGVNAASGSFWNGSIMDTAPIVAEWEANSVTWYWGGNGVYGSIEVQSKMECNRENFSYHYIAIG